MKTRSKESGAKPYRPSNGSEGCSFEDSYCDQCLFGENCPIQLAAISNNLGEPNYPSQWVYDAEGHPSCTSFALVSKQKNPRPSITTKTAEFQERVAAVDSDLCPAVDIELCGTCGEVDFNLVNIVEDISHGCLTLEIERRQE